MSMSLEDLHDTWLVLEVMKEEKKNPSDSIELHDFLKELNEN